MSSTALDLSRLFQAVTDTLASRREELNQADPVNQNHGDHMIEIFQLATRAAAERKDADLAEAMEHAGGLLRQHPQNGSAQVYARGLSQLALQFRQREIGLNDLLPYVRHTLYKQSGEVSDSTAGEVKSGEILKALLNALSAWERSEPDPLNPENGQEAAKGSSMDMGYLFGVGMSYLQAKQKGGDRLDILAETVVSASPLARVPHRYQSGKIAVRRLLEAMGD
jgi:hypothetical protein